VCVTSLPGSIHVIVDIYWNLLVFCIVRVLREVVDPVLNSSRRQAGFALGGMFLRVNPPAFPCVHMACSRTRETTSTNRQNTCNWTRV